jgi:hypothetical protein
VGLKRKHWRAAGAIRLIFKQAFERVGLPNYNPHSFRHSLAVLGEKICRTPEEWKAYSQNFLATPARRLHSTVMGRSRHTGRLKSLMRWFWQSRNHLPQPPQSVRLDDDQVRLIVNQLSKAKEDE